MTGALNYEILVRAFEQALVTKLRGHGADADYLEMWVPDEDPVKSLLNMVEAAEAYGRDDIAIEVAAETLSEAQVKELLALLGNIGSPEIAARPGGRGGAGGAAGAGGRLRRGAGALEPKLHVAYLTRVGPQRPARLRRTHL